MSLLRQVACSALLVLALVLVATGVHTDNMPLTLLGAFVAGFYVVAAT